MTEEEREEALALVSVAFDCINKNPNIAENYYNLGLAINNYNDFYNEYNIQVEENDQMAMDAYNYAIKLDPNLAKAYLKRGYMYFKKKEYNLCKADWEKAVALDPRNIEYKKQLEQLKTALNE